MNNIKATKTTKPKNHKIIVPITARIADIIAAIAKKIPAMVSNALPIAGRSDEALPPRAELIPDAIPLTAALPALLIPFFVKRPRPEAVLEIVLLIPFPTLEKVSPIPEEACCEDVIVGGEVGGLIVLTRIDFWLSLKTCLTSPPEVGVSDIS